MWKRDSKSNTKNISYVKIKEEKMKLYVIRHGNTPANQAYKMHGHTDDPLSEEGIRQAKRAKALVEELNYDFIICSPLQRARKTAEIVNQTRQKEVIIDDRLIERDCGSLEDKTIDEFDYLTYWNIKLCSKYEENETMEALMERVTQFIEEIKVKYANKNILIATHNGVCRAINAYFEGIPEDGEIKHYTHNNCEVRAYDVI